MRLLKKSLAAAAALTLSTQAAMADGPFLNEVYASHAGTDDMEMIELYGEIGTSLSGIVVLYTEGDASSSNFGNITAAWDLTSFGSMTSNYFVLGNTAVGGDLDIGANNIIQNGTETFYVVHTTDVATLLAAVGTNVDPEGDGTTTIPTMGTIIDMVGMVDTGITAVTPDMVHDGAGYVGPDGTFFPAGIYRDGDWPNSWCSQSFLDFDDVANAAQPRTPGSTNSPCATAETVSYCTAGTSASGCQAFIFTSGVPSATGTTGFHLNAGGVEGAKDGLFFTGTNGQQANVWGNGTSFQCVVPPVKRAGLLTASGNSGSCDGFFAQDLHARWVAKPAQNPGAGAVMQAQLWYRDPMNTSNQTTSLSNAVEFTVAP